MTHYFRYVVVTFLAVTLSAPVFAQSGAGQRSTLDDVKQFETPNIDPTIIERCISEGSDPPRIWRPGSGENSRGLQRVGPMTPTSKCKPFEQCAGRTVAFTPGNTELPPGSRGSAPPPTVTPPFPDRGPPAPGGDDLGIVNTPNGSASFPSGGTITDPAGNTTTIGPGGSSTIVNGSTITLPDGGSVNFADGVVLIIPPCGTVTPPGGGTIYFPVGGIFSAACGGYFMDIDRRQTTIVPNQATQVQAGTRLYTERSCTVSFPAGATVQLDAGGNVATPCGGSIRVLQANSNGSQIWPDTNDGSLACPGFGFETEQCAPQGGCNPLYNPPTCSEGINTCDPTGFNTDDKTSPDYRNSGYSQDYVADYLLKTGFVTKDYTPYSQWWALKAVLPKNWYFMNDPSYPQLSFIRDNIVNTKIRNPNIIPGQTVAVITSCRYFRGHAGIVTIYDKKYECAYIKSTNWLVWPCEELTSGNCYQSKSNFPVKFDNSGNPTDPKPLTSDCIPLRNISFMWNPKRPDGSTNATLPAEETRVKNTAAACDTISSSYCDALCNDGYETYCNRRPSTAR
jgi:hypothetical protein